MIAYPCLDVWSTCQSSYVCVLRAFASDELRFTRCALAWCLKCSDEVWCCPGLSVQQGSMCAILCSTWYKSRTTRQSSSDGSLSYLYAFLTSAQEPAMLRLSWFSAFLPQGREKSSVKYYIKTASCWEFLDQLSDSQQLNNEACCHCSYWLIDIIIIVN